jgi:molybdopterin converting factor small subunit
MDTTIHVTVLLGGSLRHEGGGGQQEFDLKLPVVSRVEDVLTRLGLPLDRVKMIMLNGRGATLETAVRQGDRVALFPPELSFNTFVSLSFRKESVEGRGSKAHSVLAKSERVER